MKATEQFDKATKTVTQERGKIYGHPFDDFARAQTLIRAIEDCKDPQIRHVLMMICVKMARLTVTPDHLDSWIDIAGYARTAVICLDHTV